MSFLIILNFKAFVEKKIYNFGILNLKKKKLDNIMNYFN